MEKETKHKNTKGNNGAKEDEMEKMKDRSA